MLSGEFQFCVAEVLNILPLFFVEKIDIFLFFFYFATELFSKYKISLLITLKMPVFDVLKVSTLKMNQLWVNCLNSEWLRKFRLEWQQ